MSSPRTRKRGEKSNAQLRLIFGIKKQRGLDDDELRSIVEEVTGQRSISALSRNDADLVIMRLGGQPLTPLRTRQHHRKRAGVVQLATASHLELMRSLARTRNLSDEGLEELSLGIIKTRTPRTTSETNKVIEALKAMNKREALWAN